jgi:hypothetical protein
MVTVLEQAWLALEIKNEVRKTVENYEGLKDRRIER